MERMRGWQGPALFSYGFRPFFLFGAAHAGLAILMFVPWFFGAVEVPAGPAALPWHMHAMLFGYVPAVAAGFLLTAVPNWTGRLPVVGWPLVGLFALWVAGRLAVSLSDRLGPGVTAALELAFLAALSATIGREIVSGRNWRNLKVLATVVLLLLADALFHWELWRSGQPIVSQRLGIAAALGLVTIIGGRIVPSFTANWLRRRDPAHAPAGFGALDKAAMLTGFVALAAWAALPLLPLLALPAAALLLVSAGLHLARLSRWSPLRTFDEPLVFVLHLAYAFVPLGFLLSALGAFSGIASHATAGIHAWTSGAVGMMTLAVMTRASRGHTGQPLTARNGTAALYVFAALAALLRIATALWPAWSTIGLGLAAIFWAAAFLGFAVLYAPMLMRPVRVG